MSRQWKWPHAQLNARAFAALPGMLSSDPATQQLLQLFIQQAIAYRSDLEFLRLFDVPKEYTGASQQVCAVTEAEDSLEFVDVNSLVTTVGGGIGDGTVDPGENGDEAVIGLANSAVIRKNDQVISSDGSSVTAITYDVAFYDPHSMADLPNNEIVIPTGYDGFYLILCWVAVKNSAWGGGGGG